MKGDIPEPVLPVVETLRRVYPHGLPETDCLAVLTILNMIMSYREVVSTLDFAGLANWDDAYVDAVNANGNVRANDDDLERVSRLLDSVGYSDWVNEQDAPEHMLPAVQILRKALAESLTEVDYLAALAVLRQTMSFRNVASMMEWAGLADWGRAYNDVMAIEGDLRPSEEDIKRVSDTLNSLGYDEWLNSDASRSKMTFAELEYRQRTKGRRKK